MGRYDLRPLRVRSMAKALVDTRRIPALPAWYNIVGDIPPGETLARPVQRAPHAKGKSRKPSRMFQPMPIRYPEDKLRQTFFGEHPWELARPRLVVEDSGNDAKNHDWSSIVQPGKQMDGESVVQRQMWLMKHQHMSKPEAYDQARREFYRHRHLEEIRRRVAKEEALHVGAYFGKGPNEIGMALEDTAFENWKAWAAQQIEEEQQMRAQMFSGPVAAEETNELNEDEFEEALQEVQDSVPHSKEGQSALGGAAMHP
ncbi:mitochondrial ribosomal protein [Lophiostoma macrostomum CBS 122681]|uniref:37S ribosomal protein S25, mitochondrial n=1 Tax=Lophiostoma macrostomum CBS 122681 TaxID=1314788 RepID=A0A6A6TPY7_9PLEO|nr:mitochondrial ribosomal protein [Lophiostoma macrostomum CBS 122681]